MPRKRPTKSTKPSTVPACRHHWIIELTEEPTSKGVCRLCGEEKVFENHVPLPEKRPERPSVVSPHRSEEPDPVFSGRHSDLI